jgi:uncharacterized SAM-binding protein YcdF (DUF218 family)
MGLAGAIVFTWCLKAEDFFCLDERLPAEVLVVEAWTGAEGAAAAAAEFKRSDSQYEYVVAAGGMTGAAWNRRRWSYAEVAEKELLVQGIPESRVILARTEASESQRTYETAVAARRALLTHGIEPKAVNVFTEGTHARRSRLIFGKVFGPTTEVGVVCWIPPGYNAVPWWRSSAMAQDLIKETIGYVFELLFNSGRFSDPPAQKPAATRSCIPRAGRQAPAFVI